MCVCVCVCVPAYTCVCVCVCFFACAFVPLCARMFYCVCHCMCDSAFECASVFVYMFVFAPLLRVSLSPRVSARVVGGAPTRAPCESALCVESASWRDDARNGHGRVRPSWRPRRPPPTWACVAAGMPRPRLRAATLRLLRLAPHWPPICRGAARVCCAAFHNLLRVRNAQSGDGPFNHRANREVPPRGQRSHAHSPCYIMAYRQQGTRGNGPQGWPRQSQCPMLGDNWRGKGSDGQDANFTTVMACSRS